MNRQTFFTLGGALLASSALTGGALAGTPGTFNVTGTTFSSTAVKVANTLFSTTAATADAVTIGGGVNFGISFCSTCNLPGGTGFNVDVTATGAAPVQSSVTLARTVFLTRSGSASFTGTVSGATANCTGVSAIGQTIYASGCAVTASTGELVGGIMFSGLQFSNANTLATVSNSIVLSGRVYNTSGSTYDTFSGAVVTAASPLTTTVTAGSNVIISALSTPNAFTYLQDTQASPAQTTVYTVALASVKISLNTNVTGSDLATAVTAGAASASVSITVTSGLLNSAASSATLNSGSAQTTAAFATSNTVTFSLDATTNSNLVVAVVYDGTTQIPSSLTAGTVTVKYTAPSTTTQAATGGSGATATAQRGGFNGELNGLYSSAISKLTTPAYNSYVRIHNQGVVAGAATVTVVHDATGVSIGSFTTSAIAAGSTLQLSAADLETGAGVTTSQIELYTVRITGPFIGYMQHVVYNPTTGQINDMSSFRNAGATIGNP